MENEKRTKIRLTKLEERNDAVYPNNIPTGSIRVGYPINKVQVGHQFLMTVIGDFSGFITSPVVEILDNQIFKTLNSIYKMEVIEE